MTNRGYADSDEDGSLIDEVARGLFWFKNPKGEEAEFRATWRKWYGLALAAVEAVRTWDYDATEAQEVENQPN